MAALPTQTAIPATIQTLIRLLLLHTAASTQSSHLIRGTSLTSLSIALISSISQGGGFALREEAEEEWTPDISSRSGAAAALDSQIPAIRVVRPLRDVGMKDCAAWAWWRGLQVVGREKLPGERRAIGGLTKGILHTTI